ncbi:MAG: trypsin-like peptidase domain-containing protein [Planctomycetota bacterium]
MNLRRTIGLFAFLFAGPCLIDPSFAQDRSALRTLEGLLTQEPKPFVIVEASGAGTVTRGQGVVISEQGHVLTVGHVGWDKANGAFVDRFRVGFRGPGDGLPTGFVHTHKMIYRDREDAEFLERFYSAKLLKPKASRFVGGKDLGLLELKADGDFPTLPFFSEQKPDVEIGEVFHLCHFVYPHKSGSPTLLMNPIEVVGVAQTTSGMQYLAKGYYRVGSSGGAILKDGRLIGLQSAAYTVNADGVGEVPAGLVSFHLVWSDLIDDHLEAVAETEDDQDSAN